MAWKVLDPNGVAYADDSGRHVIPAGGKIDDIMVERGLFSIGCIGALIEYGRIEGPATAPVAVAATEEKPLSSSNRKAKVKGKKGSEK